MVHQRAENEHACYVYAPYAGILAPTRTSLVFDYTLYSGTVDGDSGTYKTQMGLANAEVPGISARDFFKDNTVNPDVKKAVRQMAAKDATKTVLWTGDFDCKPQNILLSSISAESVVMNHIDFEYAQDKNFKHELDRWFGKTILGYFYDVPMNREEVFALSVEAMTGLERAPESRMKNGFLSNLAKAQEIIRSHGSLDGPVF
jgi:hypothetical protein